MTDWKAKIREASAFAAEALAETLWPTRCAVCDALGSVLCDSCRSTLPYIDWWRACHRCGSAFGYVQCDACNAIALDRIGRAKLPYAACASSVAFTADTGHIVRVFKDQGEQRLSRELAACMVRVMPPQWPVDVVTFVPASLQAVRRRGFDHAELLARDVAGELGVACAPLIERPSTRDQRMLSGSQRVDNLRGAFEARACVEAGRRLLLVDDVHTTGATLCAATDALLAGGAREVRCLTFARV